MRAALALIILLFSPVLAHAAASVSLSAPTVAQYEKLEFRISLPTRYHNPFDPNEVDVRAAITTPAGRTLDLPGFFFRGYVRTRDANGGEVLTPTGEEYFAVRFAWGEVGRYRYRITVADRRGTRTVGEGTFAVRPGPDPGYVRRRAAAPHYFQFDSGAPYFPIGENLAWPGAGGTYDYERWIPALAGGGGTLARIWLVNQWNKLGLEKKSCRPGDGLGLGRYDLQAAWRVDAILDIARAHGMRLMLCLDSFNTLSTGAAPCWKGSPYNRANGGPCAKPPEFFTSPAARDLFRRRLRYAVARWGYATSVFAWELWNEVEITDGYNSANVAAWHQEMARYLHAIDPWQHLVTTSFADPDGDPRVDGLSSLDFVQTHSYGVPDWAGWVHRYTSLKLARYGKPTFFGEFGLDREDFPADPTGLHIHNALWAGVHSGAAGTPLFWWWDVYMEERGLHRLFRPVAAYTAGVDWVKENYRPVRAIRIAPAPNAAGPPAYGTLALAPAGERWDDRSSFNRPHTCWVESDGTAYGLEDLSRVLHGVKNHPAWHNPVTFHVTYPTAGRFEVLVHGVSGWGGAALTLRLDGKQALSQDFPDPWPDKHANMYQYDGAYGIDVPAGPHIIVVENTGADWFYCTYRLTNYLPGNLRVLALASATSALVWAQHRDNTWSNHKAGRTPRPLPATRITLRGFTPGAYQIEQWDTWTGTPVGTTRVTSEDGALTLTTPEGMTRDVAWKVHRID